MKKIILFFVSIFLSSHAFSGSMFKCQNGNIVQKGDSKTEVRAKCGDPVSADYEGVVKRGGNMVYLDRWMYPKGNTYRILEFWDGTLFKIKN